jgi:arylsulfatase A-like enzyme
VRSALLLGLLAAFGCARGPASSNLPRPSSVLLVTVDTLRADRLGSYGDEAARTPAMDALATSGVLFEHAYTPAPLTLPAHTSIMTGLVPPAHGVRGNGGFALGPGTPTLAEALRARGLATAAFIGGFPLARRFGLARGFDEYDDAMGKPPGVSYEFAERRGDAVVQSARTWLGVHPGRVFVWVHLFDPHAPYDPPPAFRGSDPYRGEVAAADAALATLMTAWNARPGPSLVVLAADHGEAFGEHGLYFHNVSGYEPLVHVPAFLLAPGIKPDTFEGLVSHRDLYPTVLGAFGLVRGDPGAERFGRSWLRLREAPRQPLHQFVTARTHRFTSGPVAFSPMMVLVRDHHKLVKALDEDKLFELYDLDADGREENDLAWTEISLRETMERELETFRDIDAWP